jgi:Rps23 Pro-64 3,4-dihydroxylase Tpa1-like proline 4-hydroxylase
MLHFDIDSNQYQHTLPFPYSIFDEVLHIDTAKQIQAEILSIDDLSWDRYDNPFEQKYTLRDKYNFPPLLKDLFTYLESNEFIEKLSNICGYKLFADETRNFWGVHKYKGGDCLDIHVDAGIHPTMKKKKQLTLGLYLSANWVESYGCHLEIWKGDNAGLNYAKLHEKVDAIVPLFNRLVLFTCNDYAWHGNPEPATCPSESKRIFLTMSYMSDNMDDSNKRMKALFIARPQDPIDAEKDKLRLLRADPEKYKEVYRIPTSINN